MIGVFDSGFGGLTVLKKLLEDLPEYDYIYLGDNARAPYGNKSQDVVFGYTQEAVEFLFNKGCELIIIACNTASAKALRRIQQEWLSEYAPDKRVLGVVIPAAEVVVEYLSQSPKIKKRVGIIGTRSTIESGVYEQELQKLTKDLEIFSQATPLLVPLVEEGWIGKPETNMILKKYLRPLKTREISTLILGCTHYPFLLKDIERIMGKNVNIISTPDAVSVKLQDYLDRHKEIKNKLVRSSKKKFYTTDDETNFQKFCQKYLSKEKINIEKITF